jgi:oxaloacetate decarboxylase
MIEDTKLPRGFDEAKPELTSVEEGVGKMRAALAARADPALIVAGRTTVSLAGVAGAIARARAYREAGVDALFFAGLRTREELAAIAEAVPPPILIGGTPPEFAERAWLAARGVRVSLQPHLTFSAAMEAVHAALKALRDGAPPKSVGGTASPALLAEVSRQSEYDAAIARFLTSSPR